MAGGGAGVRRAASLAPQMEGLCGSIHLRNPCPTKGPSEGLWKVVGRDEARHTSGGARLVLQHVLWQRAQANFFFKSKVVKSGLLLATLWFAELLAGDDMAAPAV